MTVKTECAHECEGLLHLRDELNNCSASKDAQIDSLVHQMGGIRGDLLRLDGDIKNVTTELNKVSTALEVIAHNTTQITEFLQLYNNIKGFVFVTAHGGKLLIAVAAAIAALAYLSGAHVQFN